MRNRLLILVLVVINALSAYGQNRYLEKGNSLLNDGDLDGAEKAFKKGIKDNPNDLILQCQLGLTLIDKKNYTEAEIVLNKVLQHDSLHVGANWYSGVGSYENAKDRKAIKYFERVLPFLDKSSGQYYSANWFIGKAYSNLLRTEGLTYAETDRMLNCYDEYLRLQPNANDSKAIQEYVTRKKNRRPGKNVEIWMDL